MRPRLMLSTITSVSLFLPHSFVYSLLNHLSYAGTKWLHCRIFSALAALAGLTWKNGPTLAATPAAVAGLITSRRERPRRRLRGSISVFLERFRGGTRASLLSALGAFPPHCRGFAKHNDAASTASGGHR